MASALGTRPWNAAHAAGNIIRPLRASGQPYRGINVLLLWSAAVDKGYNAPIWLTYRQAASLGAQVRKGEHGSIVVYADKITKSETNDAGEASAWEIPFMKAYTVFNVEQIDGLPAHFTATVESPKPVERIEHAETFFAATIGITIRHGGNKAFYAPSRDLVQMPPRESFQNAEAYCATLCHELTHSTGHPSRLARELGERVGDHAYAAEELIAEMGAAFLCADLGITPEVRDDHAAYLAHWLELLKTDERAIFTAASQAQRAYAGRSSAGGVSIRPVLHQGGHLLARVALLIDLTTVVMHGSLKPQNTEIRERTVNILLPQLFPIAHPEHYKLHLACYNQTDEPLNVFVRDRSEWDGWNAWRGTRDDFSRSFIFALIDFYPETDRWLFGGAYRVLGREEVNHAPSYQIELMEEGRPYIGRLKVALKRPARAKAVNFENHYSNLVAAEILPSPYTGEAFPGYDQIDIGFSELESIFRIQRQDWRAALENAKGIYLITDKSNGRRYVGSAYGITGIWSRWSCYVQTGHGYNDELTKIISTLGIAHARTHFRFALLEHRTMKTDDNVIIEREQYWKSVLLSRGEHGYNKN